MTQIGDVFGHLADKRTYAHDEKWPLPSCCIGLELEFENAERQEAVIRKVKPTFIEFGKEPSLRGPSVELRFISPLSGVDLTTAMQELTMIVAAFEQVNGGPLGLNLRTSLHVHVDVRDLSLPEFIRFKMLSILFERALFTYCAESREYNNFCLPTYRAEGMREIAARLLVDSPKDVQNGAIVSSKYMAINFLALKEFGSVEFRMHQGTLDMQEVAEWVAILQCLKKSALAMKFDNPRELIVEVSRLGARPLGHRIFGDLWKELDYAEADLDIMKGVRFIQDLLLYPELNYYGISKADLSDVEEAIKVNHA